MNDIIHLLPDSVANQIAAGEVISRPASVIKELVENAVDAEADNIQIIVRDGGKTLIQVIDNGKGMSPTDARLAFERHATSKISSPEDLFNLQTMGFRGEALPSICAIAQVEMHTRQRGDDLGTHLIISGSKCEEQEVCSCAEGTNFMVKNLFFNTPARRRFLKSDKVELRHIMREFERLALVNHHKKMSIDLGNKTISLEPGSFAERIYSLWRDASDKELLPLNIDTKIVKISGFLGKPGNSRKLNARQFFIVNGRNMRHPMFHKAIMRNYEGIIPAGTQPNYYIRFDIDPASIDVNVHPTKHEIKFQDEAAIFNLLSSAVHSVLQMGGNAPGIEFEADYLPVQPVASGKLISMPEDGIDKNYNPFETETASSPVTRRGGVRLERIERGWDVLTESFDAPTVNSEGVYAAPVLNGMDSAAINPICFQAAKKFIVANRRDAIYVIDQHRAHVSILYNRMLESNASHDVASQGVMLTEPVELNSMQQDALEKYGKELRRLGFQLDYIEDNKWKIAGVPSLLGNTDAKTMLLDILEMADDETGGTPEDIYDSMLNRLCYSVARTQAFRGGDILSIAQMETLVRDLFILDNSGISPSGKPIYIKYDLDTISKMF